MQLLSLTAMESPVSFHADAVRSEQAKVLNAIQPLASGRCLQYSVRGNMAKVLSEMSGSRVIAPNPEFSRVEDGNVRRAQLNIDNWRWVGVPFYLRTGKRSPSAH